MPNTTSEPSDIHILVVDDEEDVVEVVSHFLEQEGYTVQKAHDGEEALEKASPDIDLILLATCTPDTFMPSAACYLQRRLGATAPAMDLNAACAGFMFALVTGAQFVKTGFSRHALVVGADIMTRRPFRSEFHPD